MKTGAVITAAGLSSRMGAFKPMLNLGGTSVVQTIIETFRRAHADPIVLVTGHRAGELESHVAAADVICIRNENYRTTDMFASAAIGMRRIQRECDRFFFTPVDVPLFTDATLRALLESGAPLCKPVCGGRDGHPILIRCDLVDAILRSSGGQGLKGALAQCGTAVTAVDVDDAGILYDADTPEEYDFLLRCRRDRCGP